MANEVLIKNGIQFLFADHATDFGAAPQDGVHSLIIGAPTDVQLDLSSLAASGGAREADKTDLTTPRAARWTVDACLEYEDPPLDGEIAEFYWGASPSSNTGTGNPGGLTGIDASFTDTTGTLAQMQFIGTLALANTVVSKGHVGVFSPIYQHGILVMVNQSITTLRSTAVAMANTHVVMTEIIDEIQ